MKTDIRSEGSRIELDDPLADGRQSETALKVWRGAARLMRQRKFACAAEVTLASARRADLLALGPKHELWIIEVKSSVADFRADQQMAGLSSTLRPVLLRYPSRCSVGHFS
jgi:hypothetical protein